jgi:transcriptional regulator with XRE-family HTH domain
MNGQRMRNARRNGGYTIDQIAKVLGTTPAHVEELEAMDGDVPDEYVPTMLKNPIYQNPTADEIAAMRMAMGWNQKEAGKYIGLSAGMISGVESYRYRLTPRLAAKFVRAFSNPDLPRKPRRQTPDYWRKTTLTDSPYIDPVTFDIKEDAWLP